MANIGSDELPTTLVIWEITNNDINVTSLVLYG